MRYTGTPLMKSLSSDEGKSWCGNAAVRCAIFVVWI
jgi:hypothetical protein